MGAEAETIFVFRAPPLLRNSAVNPVREPKGPRGVPGDRQT
jgi:hypothetical protein